MSTARFDDLTPGGASFELVDPVAEFVAWTTSDVEPALAAAEQAARDGLWVAGFVSYEAAPAFDEVQVTHPPVGSVPLVWFAAFGDRVPVEPVDGSPVDDGPEWEPSASPAEYLAAIEAIRGRIAVGDTYQVNYTYRLRRRSAGDPLRLYAALTTSQRGAYGAFIDTGDLQIASASPELFFDLDDREIRTRPMKGTARRGRWSEEDDRAARLLQASEKDRAENLMIVDLLRNDLGRVSEFGSVHVDALFEIERLETVWQMTSTISSRLRADVDLVGVFRALFPCASVTGAPKASTMEIIEGLEVDPRGVYCGSIGFIEPDARRAVFSVAIRTVVVDALRGIAEYGVGSGITWDSTGEGELAETIAKSRILESVDRPDRLFETMGWEDGEIRHVERHLDRLGRSAAYFGFEFPVTEIRSALTAVAPDPDRPHRIRLALGRDGDHEITVSGFEQSVEPVRLAIDTERVNSSDPLLFHKSEPRRRYEEARERHPTADDVVLVNERGEVTETTIANIVASIEGRWVTPPLDSGCLPGIERSVRLERGEIEEGVLTPDDLVAAKAIAVISSLRGWRDAVLM
jgi:para-aminobenzoate synthetase/4-amino-4-deoxychorismate lyase